MLELMIIDSRTGRENKVITRLYEELLKSDPDKIKLAPHFKIVERK